MENQGNKNDRNTLRREREEMRHDSMRMKQDTARMMFDSTLRRGPVGDTNRPTDNKGTRPTGSVPMPRGERDRMELPPTPNSNRRDSLRPR